MNEEKVAQVVRKMLSDSSHIISVEKSEDYDESGIEYYFTYPSEKFMWSIAESAKGDHFLFFYPSSQDKNNFLRFASNQIGIMGVEDLKSLFKLVESKAYGFDEVLKEILGH